MGAPGVFDFAEDLKAGHDIVVGQSTGDKVGNVLTHVGTVLDFIPGLEWLGGLTIAAAAVSSTVGEVEDKVQDDKAEKATAASVNNVPTVPTVPTVPCENPTPVFHLNVTALGPGAAVALECTNCMCSVSTKVTH